MQNMCMMHMVKAAFVVAELRDFEQELPCSPLVQQ